MSEKDTEKDVLEVYRQTGKFVCPYAKQRPHYETLPVFSGSELNRAINDKLVAFLKSQQGILILVLDTELASHQQGYEYAQAIYHALVKAGSSIDGLEEEREPGQCTFECQDQRFLVFAMNPLYHPSHPRYSPRPIMVLTYYNDIKKVPMSVALGIREKALEGLAHAHSPDIPMELLAGKIKVILDEVTKKVRYIDVDDSVATPDIMAVVQKYGMKTPLYAFE